ncbi:hypothetical protein QTI66_10805 [Variovorax sp. J22R133]|uniref:hypothetical protein n=1 Tax=Variovorax brevis TaxID=3053503 RepID=UPI0025789E60|nr:hypothetical protein [Variovorax sp. J22R133]MDM0112639.1 hypothetical protein [Variovorax sp. J22R133]
MLLIRMGEHLVINVNDSPDFGASFHVRRMSKACTHAYLLALQSWGAVDMINVHDAEGRRIPSPGERRLPLGLKAQASALAYGANRIIPFSSFHRYQRTDSMWANNLVPELADYGAGAAPDGPEILPAFVRIDCERDAIEALAPPRRPTMIHAPESFGDFATDALTQEDSRALESYFRAHAHLQERFGFLHFRVGGTEHGIRLNPAKPDIGIRFEAPRHSLMHSVAQRTFDDLLIGNYAKVYLHGLRSLYPDFTPYVAKFGDNGNAGGANELWRYFGAYVMRDPVGYAMHCLRTSTEQVMRAAGGSDDPLARGATGRRQRAGYDRKTP